MYFINRNLVLQTYFFSEVDKNTRLVACQKLKKYQKMGILDFFQNFGKPRSYFSEAGMSSEARSPKFDPVAYMQDVLKNNKAVIISDTKCPHCTIAFKFFTKLEYEHTTKVINLDQWKDTEQEKEFSRQLFKDVVRHTDFTMTVPKVFVCGKYVGGCREVMTLYQDGTLKRLLDNCDLSQLEMGCHDR